MKTLNDWISDRTPAKGNISLHSYYAYLYHHFADNTFTYDYVAFDKHGIEEFYRTANSYKKMYNMDSNALKLFIAFCYIKNPARTKDLKMYGKFNNLRFYVSKFSYWLKDKGYNSFHEANADYVTVFKLMFEQDKTDKDAEDFMESMFDNNFMKSYEK